MPHVFGLGRHPDFLKLRSGQTISLVGSEITLLVLPLTAILVLKATPIELGILSAAQSAPFLLLSLPAGVWVDRLPRRPMLVAADLGRAFILGSVPIAAMVGSLHIELLYLVGICAGALTAIFDVAYQSFLPQVVPRERLVERNTDLEISRSMAQIVGPSSAGLLVQWLTAPVAIVADAISFIVSAVAFASLRTPAPVRVTHDDRRNIMAEIREGLSVVSRSPLLRTLAIAGSAYNLFGNILFAGFLLYATSELGLQPATLGLIFSVAGPAALAGALLSSRIPRRLGLGRTLVGALAVGAIGRTLILFAGGPPEVVVMLLVAARVLLSVWVPIYSVTALSLRQAITPDHLQGRVTATMRFIGWGTLPIGSLIGGALGSAIGLRPTIGLAVIGTLVSVGWFLLSPIRGLRQPPAEIGDRL
jgi:MFS family permease